MTKKYELIVVGGGGLRHVNKELYKRSSLEKLALSIVLALAGGLFLYGALQNDMANSYYAAAVQAASRDWTAWLFGSLDAANYISVDKPPIAIMIMGLSARIFGFSSFSMLLPSVLAGVGSIWLLYASVKRQFGFNSAIIAAGTLTITPVAALMFGFNNPDAILTFLLMASAYAFLRSLENKQVFIWLGLAALFTGLAFNTKMLQGLMVLPAMSLVYLIFAQPPIITRILNLLFAGVATAISTFWWSILVCLTPAASRPWVGNTSDNSIWSLIFEYNGFERIFGSNGFGGETGALRMFNTDFSPNIAWLLLFALLGGGVLLLMLRNTPRDDRVRAAVIFWLLWLSIHVVVFSTMSGIIHPYYVVVMAPAIAALVGISLPFVWAAYQRRKAYAIALPLMILATTATATIIVSYNTSFDWLGWIIALSGIVGTAGLTANIYRPRKLLLSLAVVSSLVSLLFGPVVYTVSTVIVSHSGSIPTSGPAATAIMVSNNDNSAANSELVKYLIDNRDEATWIVAVSSADESAAIQLISGEPVMAVGGFSGSDTPLTLDEFKELVSSGKVKYYAVKSQSNRRGGRSNGNGDISSWVISSGVKINYGDGNLILYELSV